MRRYLATLRGVGAAVRMMAATAATLTPLCAAQGPAAQDANGPSSGKSEQPVMYATFGFGGTLPAEHWGPITLYVTAGERPLSGAIVVEFDQDSTQKARITVPFSATPERTTPVPIVAALRTLCERVDFTMVNERGQALHHLAYARNPDDRTALMPTPLDDERALVVSVGRTTVPESVRDWSILYSALLPTTAVNTPPRRVGEPRDIDEAWSLTGSGRVEVDELPISWMAYDGVRVLVINPQPTASRSVDPRAQEAVRAWVRSGGRLVVLADGPGDTWRDWLPDEARDAISLEPPEMGPVPQSVAKGLTKAAADTEARLALQPDDVALKTQVPGPADHVPRRILRLSDTGKSLGWSIRWGLDEDTASGAGLLAEGPAGYGIVTILGLDPARAPATLSVRGTSLVWRDALSTLMDDWMEDAFRIAKARAGMSWGVYAQAAPARAANAAIERVGHVPIPSDWIFLLIAGAMGLLAAMVGPIDYFALKRLKAGHRSWLTAMAWIGLASAFAYAGPRLLRAQPTQVNRLSVIDCVASRPGQGERAAFSTAITGVYSGESGRAKVENPDPASWWRGIATRYPWRGFGDRTPGAIVPTLQAAAGGQSGSMRGNPLAELPIALWTFRSLTDSSVPGPDHFASRLMARVTPSGDGCAVMVAGLPENAKVVAAAAQVGDQWYTIDAPPQSQAIRDETADFLRPRVIGGRVATSSPAHRANEAPPEPPRAPIGRPEGGSWSVALPHASSKRPADWDNPAPDYNNPNAFMYWGDQTPASNDSRPGTMLEIPGPDRRTQAVSDRVRGGRWAAVYLSVEGLPPETRLAWPSRYEHTCVLRLLVPLEGAAP
jgi:hypothetical protein